jgi:3-deoxy-manno-octulosonate cytidylyltransferase (CMP-KDO synthetase)
MLKQVCVIPFRRDFLLKFLELEPTTLEIVESVDMLKAMEHQYKVKMVLSNSITYSVDTQTDLEKVTDMMKDDVLLKLYE